MDKLLYLTAISGILGTCLAGYYSRIVTPPVPASRWGSQRLNMANQWFKFYGGEYLSDPKMDRLSPLERSCWLTLLCLASMNGDGIVEFLTVETLLNKSGIQFDPYHPEEWERALSVLKKFVNMKMIETSEEGFIKIINWEKRQMTSLTAAERQAKYRENRKSNEKITERVTKVTLEENRIEENRVITAKAEKKEEEPEYKRETDEEAYRSQRRVPPDKNSASVMAWAEAHTGRRFPNPKKQLGQVKVMLSMGYTQDAIQAKWLELEEDEFWSERGIDFGTVLSNIAKVKKKSEGGVLDLRTKKD